MISIHRYTNNNKAIDKKPLPGISNITIHFFL